MTGFLLVDKPAGPTSHDIVDVCRRALGMKRVGHAGTLDPPASGLVVVAAGPATRLLRYVQGLPKVYETTGRLGVRTTTLDADGEVVSSDPVDVTASDVHRVAAGFSGDIEQVPPAVSAVKVAGERAYKRAARGETVEIAPRRVHIYGLDVLDVTDESFRLRVRCSAGTYIRSLVADIGDALGCGAHVTELRRTAIGSLDVAEAVPPDAIGPDAVLPVHEALRDLPRVEVDADTARRAQMGQRVQAVAPAEEVLVVGPDGAVGVFAAADDGMVRPVTVLGRKQ